MSKSGRRPSRRVEGWSPVIVEQLGKRDGHMQPACRVASREETGGQRGHRTRLKRCDPCWLGVEHRVERPIEL